MFFLENARFLELPVPAEAAASGKMTKKKPIFQERSLFKLEKVPISCHRKEKCIPRITNSLIADFTFEKNRVSFIYSCGKPIPTLRRLRPSCSSERRKWTTTIIIVEGAATQTSEKGETVKMKRRMTKKKKKSGRYDIDKKLKEKRNFEFAGIPL